MDIRKFFTPGGGAAPKKNEQQKQKQKKDATAPERQRPAADPSRGRHVIDLAGDDDDDRPTTSGRTAAQAASPRPVPEKKKKASEGPEVPPAVRTAVDRAISALPVIDIATVDRIAPGTTVDHYNAPALPPNHGQTDVPSGSEFALLGKTFVISGTLNSLTKDEARDFIKKHGGRVTEAVSSKTDFLVVGKQCGNTKLNKAAENGTRLIDEDGVLSLVRCTVALAAPAAAPGPGPSRAPAAEPARPAAAAAAAARRSDPSSAQLWTEKYRPREPADLVGHQTLLNVLRHWLTTWEDVFVHGKPPTSARGGGSSSKYEKPMKAVLLCGSPGLGKTSMATIMSRSLGFSIVEINASDTRNQAEKDVNKGINGRLANVIKEMVTNRTIGVAGGGNQRRKPVLIMDEVDGLAGNNDRGGIADLIKTIQDSKVPIICICNDKYSMKIRSLRNHCMEMDFRKPNASSVRVRLAQICEREGVAASAATLEKLAESCGCDIRACVNHLQMVSRDRKSIDFDTMKRSVDRASKDLDMSAFTATGDLFGPAGAKKTLNQLLDLSFVDADFIPLLVQENYLNYQPGGCGNDMQRLFRLGKAAEMISDADVTNRLVRMEQKWGLMPLANVLGCVYPARLASGQRTVFGLHPGEMNFTRMTAYMGSLSSGNKQKRILGELHSHMLSSGNFLADRSSLRLGYMACMKKHLTHPLRQLEKEVRSRTGEYRTQQPPQPEQGRCHAMTTEFFTRLSECFVLMRHYPLHSNFFREHEDAPPPLVLLVGLLLLLFCSRCRATIHAYRGRECARN